MVIDTSAIIAILRGEPESDQFQRLIAEDSHHTRQINPLRYAPSGKLSSTG